ncbi:hypothetical protein [Acetomicrobium sp. S15 = DSM 107314]|uniref:hypothetical protein n=1 Tax=Acetomicrobium sp. S15 = DSM 107314 TaxID=2529858 RepID=UPI0018E1774F|nr:hypothetical protein [Acetomicrobium sp. S15 = DSM 107314]
MAVHFGAPEPAIKRLYTFVSQSGGKWFVSIQTERGVEQLVPEALGSAIPAATSLISTQSG